MNCQVAGIYYDQCDLRETVLRSLEKRALTLVPDEVFLLEGDLELKVYRIEGRLQDCFLRLRKCTNLHVCLSLNACLGFLLGPYSEGRYILDYFQLSKAIQSRIYS